MPLHRVIALASLLFVALPAADAQRPVWPGRSSSLPGHVSNPPAATVRARPGAQPFVHTHNVTIGYGSGAVCDAYERPTDTRLRRGIGPSGGRPAFPSSHAPRSGWSGHRVTVANRWNQAPAHGGWPDGESDWSNCGLVTSPVTPAQHGGAASLGNIHWSPCERHHLPCYARQPLRAGGLRPVPGLPLVLPDRLLRDPALSDGRPRPGRAPLRRALHRARAPLRRVLRAHHPGIGGLPPAAPSPTVAFPSCASLPHAPSCFVSPRPSRGPRPGGRPSRRCAAGFRRQPPAGVPDRGPGPGESPCAGRHPRLAGRQPGAAGDACRPDVRRHPHPSTPSSTSSFRWWWRRQQPGCRWRQPRRESRRRGRRGRLRVLRRWLRVRRHRLGCRERLASWLPARPLGTFPAGARVSPFLPAVAACSGFPCFLRPLSAFDRPFRPACCGA